jgi:hypothetical protein
MILQVLYQKFTKFKKFLTTKIQPTNPKKLEHQNLYSMNKNIQVTKHNKYLLGFLDTGAIGIFVQQTAWNSIQHQIKPTNMSRAGTLNHALLKLTSLTSSFQTSTTALLLPSKHM